MAEQQDGLIARINNEAAHQISTTQKIVSVAGACKELLENCIDAHATSIGQCMMLLLQLYLLCCIVLYVLQRLQSNIMVLT